MTKSLLNESKAEKKKADKIVAIDQASQEIAKFPKMEDVGHLTPSNAKSFAVCPSYLPEPYNEEKTTGDEGTMLHEIMAGIPSKFELTDEQKLVVEQCQLYVEDVIATAHQTGEVKVFREIKLPVNLGWVPNDPNKTGEKDLKKQIVRNGLLDLLLLQEATSEIHVIDYKFGRIQVDDAGENYQGFFYAIAALDYFEKYKPKSVIVHFLQPRCDFITIETFSAKDIEMLREEMFKVYLRTLVEVNKREHIYNADNCLYCWRKTICPAVIQTAKQTALQYDPDAIPIFASRPSETINPNDFGVMFHTARVMEKWADSVKHHTTQMLLAGHDISGIKLTERAGEVGLDRSRNGEIFESFKSVMGPEALAHFMKTIKINLDSLLEELPADVRPEFIKQLNKMGAITFGNTSYFAKKI